MENFTTSGITGETFSTCSPLLGKRHRMRTVILNSLCLCRHSRLADPNSGMGKPSPRDGRANGILSPDSPQLLPQSCEFGRGGDNASITELAIDDWESCMQECARRDECAAFDFIANGAPDSCRLYRFDNEPLYGGGNRNEDRMYCHVPSKKNSVIFSHVKCFFTVFCVVAHF